MDSSKKNSAVDPEEILITLDQVSQTIDIMNSVVGRLKNYLVDHLEELEVEATTRTSNKKQLRLDLREELPKVEDVIH